MGVFLDPKQKKPDCRSQNHAREGLAFFPVAKNVCLLNFVKTVKEKLKEENSNV